MTQKVNAEKERTGLPWILFLAIPAVIENFFQTIIGFVDTYFVSQIGITEVSAVGVTNALLQVYFAIFMALGVAANIYVAKYTGAKNAEKAQQSSWQSIYLAIIAGIVFGVVTLFFAEPMLKLMGAESAVIDAGKTYFKIVAIPSIILSLTFVVASILRGTGDTKTPMKISIYVNLLNIVLDYVLIFGFWIIPGFGLVGAATATVIARLIGVIWLLSIFLKREGTREAGWKRPAINFGEMKKLLTVGAPASGERLVMRIGQVLYFGIIVSLGTATFAAHQIAGSIEVFSYMIGYGFATAATTIVGQLIGAGRIEESQKYALQCTAIAVGFMSIVGLILFFSAEWLAGLFTTDTKVIADITVALRIDAFIQPILAIVLVLTGVYQGGGNTKTPMYITAIGIWLLRTVFVYVLGLAMGFGIAGVWIAIGIDNLFRAIWLSISFIRGNWIKEGFEEKAEAAN
ncbi:MATE family efflux transporter [Thalassobacillus hwangdonensis]|uniref:Probable multidrug resistance protein NorM n=1 Tax=Thalassobacillus hwangdonensis TaxID=546108 RepID=A0ABW3L3Z6_9BACI